MRLIDADALKTKKVRSAERSEWVVPVAEIDWMPTVTADPDTVSRQAVIDAWKNDFKGYINALDMPKDDYNGIMEYIDEVPSVPSRPQIHCKDCKHCYPPLTAVVDNEVKEVSDFRCSRMFGFTEADGWCYMFERKSSDG